MTVRHNDIPVRTTRYQDYVIITNEVERAVEDSGIKEGMAFVMSLHTTAGIGMNEAMECVESDLEEMLERAVPEHHPYSHGRMLHSYGSTAGNPQGHLRAHLTGSSISLPVTGGKLRRGGAQDIYLYEFDGPSQRTVVVTVIGETGSE